MKPLRVFLAALLALAAPVHAETLVNPLLISPQIQSGRGTLTRVVRADLAKTAPAIAAGVLTLNLALSNFFNVPLVANVTTMTVSNPQTTGTASSFILLLRADGTPRTIAWMSGVTWINNGGAAPTPSSTSGKCDKYTAFTYDGGTTWYVTVDAQNFTCGA